MCILVLLLFGWHAPSGGENGEGWKKTDDKGRNTLRTALSRRLLTAIMYMNRQWYYVCMPLYIMYAGTDDKDTGHKKKLVTKTTLDLDKTLYKIYKYEVT